MSIILVLFAHVADHISPYAPYGGFGVESFFVLSGFLITYLLCSEEDRHGLISLPSFYARRALRILPPALLFIAFASMLGLVGLASVTSTEPLYAAFFVRNLMPNGGQHLGHFWSLAIEEQFYLLWPLAFLLLRSNRRRLLFASLMFLVAPFWKHGMFKLAGGAMYVNSWRFDLRYDALMAGCCLALIRNDPGLSRLLSNKLFKSALGALLALAAVGFGMVGLPVAVFSQSLSFVGVAVFINFAIQRPNGFVGGLLNGKPIIWIGQLSYSLYLWQQIFCWHSKLLWLGQFPQNIIASVVAAALSYYLLEIPLAEFRKTIPYLPNPRFLMRVIRSSRNLVQDDGLLRSNNSAHSDEVLRDVPFCGAETSLHVAVNSQR